MLIQFRNTNFVFVWLNCCFISGGKWINCRKNKELVLIGNKSNIKLGSEDPGTKVLKTLDKKENLTLYTMSFEIKRKNSERINRNIPRHYVQFILASSFNKEYMCCANDRILLALGLLPQEMLFVYFMWMNLFRNNYVCLITFLEIQELCKNSKNRILLHGKYLSQY